MWEQAKSDYMAGMKYKEIAEKYNVSLSTVKSWKTRYKWDRKGTRTKSEKVCVQNEKSTHTKKHGGQPGNQNAKGHGAPKKNQNSVGHKSSVPMGNHNAMTHGLYAKYLPPETLEIADSLESVSPIDILWGNIKIKYASILRAQQIMFVHHKDDLTKELKRQKESQGETSESWEKEYELQFAWDKQAAFLNAQSNAMKTLTAMIKQYDNMCKSDLATEEQRLRIQKLKAEVQELQENDNVEIVDDLGGDDDAGKIE